MRRCFIAFLALLAVILTCLPAAAGEITVGYAVKSAPMTFEQDGEPDGFDIDLWSRVAEKLGVDYKLQPMAFADIIPALQDGKIDAALGGITITSKRERIIDFSHPYFESGLIIAVKTDNDDIQTINDLRGKTVATVSATTSADLLEALQQGAGAGNSQTSFGRVKLYPEFGQAMEAVRYGHADAVLFDLPMVLYYLRTQAEGTLKVVGPVYRRQVYGLAFPPDSALRGLASIAILEMMETGQYNKIFRKWFGSLSLIPQ